MSSTTRKKASPDLIHLLDNAAEHDIFDVNIFLRGEPAAATLAHAATANIDVEPSAALQERLDMIKSRANAAQEGLLSFLDENRTLAALADSEVSVPQVSAPESFWITNAVGTRTTARMLRKILERQDVELVDISRHVPVEELLDAKKKATGARKTKRPAAGPVRKKGKAAKKAGPPAVDDAPEVAWSVRHINAPLCWQLGLDGKGVLVAIVDTGVNYSHPDLKSRMWNGGAQWPNHGYDFENGDVDPQDNQGHGTATAGQVAGDGTSGTRTGVAPKATIVAIRVGGVERNFWNGLPIGTVGASAGGSGPGSER